MTREQHILMIEEGKKDKERRRALVDSLGLPWKLVQDGEMIEILNSKNPPERMAINLNPQFLAMICHAMNEVWGWRFDNGC